MSRQDCILMIMMVVLITLEAKESLFGKNCSSHTTHYVCCKQTAAVNRLELSSVVNVVSVSTWIQHTLCLLRGSAPVAEKHFYQLQ